MNCGTTANAGYVLIIFLSLILVSTARPIYPLPSKISHGSKQPLQTSRPYNIAHRGSNGEIPEETAAAYKRAIEEGVDFIEADILSSKDGVLICFHDVTLMTQLILQSTRSSQIVKGPMMCKGSTLLAFSLVKWSDGKRFEDKFVGTLKKYGYNGSYMSKDWLKQPIFIQSFAPTSLVYINLTDSPKIFLIDDVTIPTQDTNQVHPYTYRNEDSFLHYNFHQDPYEEYDYWINTVGVDGLFTDFPGSLHNFQEWTSPLSKDECASKLLHKIALLTASYKN
ncbi:hypothetical protein GH714_043852 [Hevea brasiliensis]|uniref:glycerophosphodiester phosphodiesterase n=1 Tax=Hevea brasiliensis TaxID=3981 RepID=A0A6A6K1X7_HEVBR|nr:hypothetical protein GH714_043852 [Hevea brasiliensis]